MIYKCKCGALKNAQPWRCAGEGRFLCQKCVGDAKPNGNGKELE